MVKKSSDDITVKSENCAEGDSVGSKQELTSLNINKDVDDSTKLQDANKLEKEWICGDVIWARISGHPFWPGLITTDPNNGLYVKTRKGRGESTSKVYHVQYFGDRGSHSWVSASQIMEYEGETKLRDIALSKKKDKRYLGAVPDPKASNAFKWQCAVKEADDAILSTRTDRLVFFEECFPVMIVNKGKTSKDVEVKKKKMEVEEEKKEKKHMEKEKNKTAMEEEEKKKETVMEEEEEKKVMTMGEEEVEDKKKEKMVKEEKMEKEKTAEEKKRKVKMEESTLVFPSTSGISTKHTAAAKDKISVENTSSDSEDEKIAATLNEKKGKGESKTGRKVEGKLDFSAPSTTIGKKRMISQGEDGTDRSKRARVNKSTTGVNNGKKKQIKKKSNIVNSKIQYKKKNKNEPGSFEVFVKKSTAHCIQINSKFADDEDALRLYLLKMWETLNDSEKSKFSELSAMRS